jgi:hypothetical protein
VAGLVLNTVPAGAASTKAEKPAMNLSLVRKLAV